jgi:chemotaxis signal transduction protein
MEDVNVAKAVEASRHLCFSLAEEEYAVPLANVREVIEIPDITPVPHAPGHYRGIMNLSKKRRLKRPSSFSTSILFSWASSLAR